MKRSKRVWWLAAVAALLAIWALFWYLPRPLLGDSRSRTVCWVWIRSDRSTVDVMTDRVDLQRLDAVLEDRQIRPAFRTEYFPYYSDDYPVEICLQDDGKPPWHIIAGPKGAVAYDGMEALVWPIMDGEALWQELSALLPASG